MVWAQTVNAKMSNDTNDFDMGIQGILLLTWFNFIPGMDE